MPYEPSAFDPKRWTCKGRISTMQDGERWHTYCHECGRWERLEHDQEDCPMCVIPWTSDLEEKFQQLVPVALDGEDRELAICANHPKQRNVRDGRSHLAGQYLCTIPVEPPKTQYWLTCPWGSDNKFKSHW